MKYFDLHVHPSLKGNLTRSPKKYNAWNRVYLFIDLFGILKPFNQIINSQANLSKLNAANVLSVVALVAIEKAFARNKIIKNLLANIFVSPLSRRLLNQVENGRRSYYSMFQRDLNHLLAAKKIRDFNLVNEYKDLHPLKLNIILSVEGAHSFQSVRDDAGPEQIGNSILENFIAEKNNKNYRFHHLTLTHLTRQPACVHCFGVRMKHRKRDVFPDPDFQPDSERCGLSPLGKEIIRAAYDSTESKRILIDVKHMSFVSRRDFYLYKSSVAAWKGIPIIVSHAGVTGCKFEDAKIIKIIKGATDKDCDEVFWDKREGYKGSCFNPWTINLYDDDIVEILKSAGLIGVSLDERILGFGEILAEFMSKKEVKELQLKPLTEKSITEETYLSEQEANLLFEKFSSDEEVQTIIISEQKKNPEFNISQDEFLRDMIFDLDHQESIQINSAKSQEECFSSHINHLANNILHIIKVGFAEKFDGTGGKVNVCDCICLGSDLDGIVDALNFPFKTGENSVDQNNWVTANEYEKLAEELIASIKTYLALDSGLQKQIQDVEALVTKIMYTNGNDFLQKHFT